MEHPVAPISWAAISSTAGHALVRNTRCFAFLRGLIEELQVCPRGKQVERRIRLKKRDLMTVRLLIKMTS